MGLQSESILNLLDDAILVADENGRVLFANDAARRLFRLKQDGAGDPSAEATSTWATLLPQLTLADALVESAPDQVMRLITIPQANGDLPPFEARVQRWSDGGQFRGVVTVRDPAFQQQTQRIAITACNAETGDVMAQAVAHDFNNILTGVLSQLDLALKTGPMPAESHDNVTCAQASAMHGADVIRQWQQYIRLANPTTALADLATLMEPTATLLRRGLGPRFEVHCAFRHGQTWPVPANAREIMNLVLGLGLLARDRMPAGGRVTLHGENVPLAGRPPQGHKGDFVRLSVKFAATGKTFPPTPDKKLHAPCTIAHHIAARHGGWFNDTRADGMEVEVFLPRSLDMDEEPVCPAATPVVEPKVSSARERILLVDDEEAVRMVIRAVLASRGYAVTEARNAEDAIRDYAGADTPFALVMADLHLPGSSGIELLAKLRERNPLARAILLSGGLNERELAAIRGLGGVEFLPKPFDNEELLNLVQRVLERRG